MSYREAAPAPAGGASGEAAERATVTLREWSGARRANAGADRAGELARLRGYLGTVNQLATEADATLGPEQRVLREVELRELRLGLLRAHWGPDLGDWAAFRDWIAAAAPGEAPPAALAGAVALYRHGR